MSHHVPPSPFATLYSSQTQTIANAANAQAITFNSTAINKGIVLIDNSKMSLPQVGNYALSFSAIGYNKGSANSKTFNIFLRKNNSDVAASSSIVALAKQLPTTVVATFDVSCTNPGDYYQLMMAGEDTDCQILATAAQNANPGVSPAQPSCPSIVVAVWQIN